MRKFGFVLMALLCMSFAIPALAAEKGEMTFGLGGGMAVPTGDVGDVFKAGFMGGVFGDYALTPMFAVGVDASFSQFKGKDLPAALDVSDAGDVLLAITDAKLTPLQFGAHVKVAPPMTSPILPYLQVGAGFYNVKFEETITSYDPALDIFAGSGDVTKSKFGFNVAVGADYKVNPQIGVGLFGAFHSITDAYEAESVDFATGDVTIEKKTANYMTAGVRITFSTGATTTASK